MALSDREAQLAAATPGRAANSAWAWHRALYVAGFLTGMERDQATARTLLARSLTTMRELGDDRQVRAILLDLGLVYMEAGEFAAATAALEEALAISRRQNDPLSVPAALAKLGEVVYWQHNHAEALPLLQESMALSERAGHHTLLAEAKITGARIRCEQHEDAHAQGLAAESLALARKVEYSDCPDHGPARACSPAGKVITGRPTCCCARALGWSMQWAAGTAMPTRSAPWPPDRPRRPRPGTRACQMKAGRAPPERRSCSGWWRPSYGRVDHPARLVR